MHRTQSIQSTPRTPLLPKTHMQGDQKVIQIKAVIQDPLSHFTFLQLRGQCCKTTLSLPRAASLSWGAIIHMTQSQLVCSFQSQSWVKVKVVKWCPKSEMSIISITNNMKSYKKITETAQTANFIDFPLILCGNGPKGTKTMQTQTLFSQIGKFGTSGTFKIVRTPTKICLVQGMPSGFLKMWLFLLLLFFKPEL